MMSLTRWNYLWIINKNISYRPSSGFNDEWRILMSTIKIWWFMNENDCCETAWTEIKKPLQFIISISYFNHITMIFVFKNFVSLMKYPMCWFVCLSVYINIIISQWLITTIIRIILFPSTSNHYVFFFEYVIRSLSLFW
jgi:hypothetical protein